MNDALFVCQQHFKTYWGQKLVNVIRPLHSILYNEDENEDFSDETETEINMEDLWD